MTAIGNDKNKDIKSYLMKYFKSFLHNRVGTKLTNDEFENINNMIAPKLRKGGLAVLQERFNDYRWVMVLKS